MLLHPQGNVVLVRFDTFIMHGIVDAPALRMLFY